MPASRSMKINIRTSGCGIKPIAGAVNQPKEASCCAKPIHNSVAMQPKEASVSRIKGAISGPK